MKRTPRWLRLSLLVVCVMVLGFVGYALARHYLYDVESRLKAAESAYAEGLHAFDARDFARARTRFDEARLRADSLLQQLEKAGEAVDNKTQDEIDKARDQAGRVFWLKARSLRGLAFSAVAAEGKPLPAALESAGGEQASSGLTRISFRRIPDDVLRREAFVALRSAALRLPDNLDLQKEALRNETQEGVSGPTNWTLAARYATQVLKLEPTNTRALAFMARFDYEQPAISTDRADSGTSTPIGKRSRERMLRARQYLTKLKEAEKPLRWPTVHLEALIHQWLIGYYRSAMQLRPAEERQEEEALRVLLEDADQGALHRADQETRLATLTRADLDAMMALHVLALERVIDRSRRRGREPDSAAGEQVLKVLDATLAMCKKLAGREENTPAQLGDIAENAVASAFKAQPFLANDKPTEWAGYVDAAQALAQTAAEKKAGTPRLYFQLIELLSNEATAQGNKGQSARQEELRAQAIKWVDDGLRVGNAEVKAGRLTATQLTPLHEAAARMKLVATGKRDDLTPHLKAMKESRSPSAQGWALLLEGFFSYREGRLGQARVLLEQSVRLAPGEVARRAHMILANVYMGLGQPDKALASLREVDAIQAQFQTGMISDEERQWYEQFVRSTAESAYVQFQAHVTGALQKHNYVVREKLTGRAREPYARAIAAHETAFSGLLARLAKTPQHEPARHLLVEYWLATDRLDRAREELAALKADKPDSLRVLQQEVRLIVRPVAGLPGKDPSRASAEAEADRRIEEFIGRYPNDTSARLFHAQWLAATGRASDASAYAADRANFPDLDSNPALKQKLALLQLNVGDPERVRQLVGELPSGPARDQMEILLASSESERQAKIMEAMPRYENNGIFRCHAARIALGKKDYVEAAKGYLSAIEYTRVRETARAGLASTLLSLAQEDPLKARELAGQMLGNYPGERSLLLAYAFACLLLDDLGNPSEATDQVKDMSTALNALEQASLREGEPIANAIMTKATFWSLASRPDRARTEALRALERNPKHEAALLLAAQLALEAQEPSSLAAGQKHLETLLKDVNRDSLQGLLLQARYHIAAGRTPEAIAALETAIEKHPAQSAGYASLVTLLERHGQKELAAKWTEQWRTRIPEDVNGAAARVRQLAAAGRLPEAQRLAEQTVAEQVRLVSQRLSRKLGGNTPRPLETGDPDEHKQRQVDNARVAGQLVMALAFNQAGAFNDAERWVGYALNEQPDSVEGQLLLGDIYLQRLHSEFWVFLRPYWVEKAYTVYGKVYALQRGHVAAGNNLAWLLTTEMHEPEKALTIAREVRQGTYSKRPRPGDRLPAELLDTFGVIHRSLAKPELNTEMRDLFQAAVKRYATDPRMYLHLGRAYAGLQDKTRANEQFATAIAISKSRSTLPGPVRQSVIQEAEAEQKKLALPPGRSGRSSSDF